MIKIIYKSRDITVINKPIGIPSESDPTGAPDALTLTSEALKQTGEDGTLYLVHRLDRVTGGTLAFARNKKAAGELSALFASHNITKEYLAVCDGETEDKAELSDLLYRDARAGKAFIVDRERGGVKHAELEYRTLARAVSEGGIKSLVLVTLKTGRFHQIRAQLSHRKTPITGDGKYGSRDKCEGIALHSARLVLPISKRTIKAVSMPDMTKYPWSLFDAESIEKELML